MLRGLYRFYLYSVFIAMLLFATTGVIQLLTMLFQNIFKEPYNTPGAASLVQAVVFGVVALVIATLFGGLHYWLIRRDMQNDPMAGNSAVRTFFLNAVELVILPRAVISGASSISALGQPLFAGAAGVVGEVNARCGRDVSEPQWRLRREGCRKEEASQGFNAHEWTVSHCCLQGSAGAPSP